MTQTLKLDPNPLIVKTQDSILSFHLINPTSNFAVFAVSNESDFSRVSPLAGRVTPGETTDLTVSLMRPPPVSLQISYSMAATESELMAQTSNLTECVSAAIRAPTHEELTMDSLRKSRKGKKDRPVESVATEEQRLQLLRQSVEGKRAEAAELRARLESLKAELQGYGRRTEDLREKRGQPSVVVWIAVVVLLIAILKKVLSSRKN
jgi:hypothetical protein